MPIESWKDNDIPQELQQQYLSAKENWCIQELTQLYQENNSRKGFGEAVYQKINDITESTKIYMCEDMSRAMPKDYKTNPGKPDHAGSILGRVGKIK